MCFANAVVYSDSNNNRKLDKKKAAGRIDGAVATAMAVGVMADAHRSYLEYETLMVL
jgi:phage terminase large subunit-like protein